MTKEQFERLKRYETKEPLILVKRSSMTIEVYPRHCEERENQFTTNLPLKNFIVELHNRIQESHSTYYKDGSEQCYKGFRSFGDSVRIIKNLYPCSTLWEIVKCYSKLLKEGLIKTSYCAYINKRVFSGELPYYNDTDYLRRDENWLTYFDWTEGLNF